MPGKTEIVWRLHLVVVSSQCFWCFAKCIRICFFPENGPRTLQRGSPEHSGLDRHCMHCSQLKPYVWHPILCALNISLYVTILFVRHSLSRMKSVFFSFCEPWSSSVCSTKNESCLLACSLTYSLTHQPHTHTQRESVSQSIFLSTFFQK